MIQQVNNYITSCLKEYNVIRLICLLVYLIDSS
jgi:hypothetical protein